MSCGGPVNVMHINGATIFYMKHNHGELQAFFRNFLKILAL